eukprot:6999765-Prymnesium_polylepis.1
MSVLLNLRTPLPALCARSWASRPGSHRLPSRSGRRGFGRSGVAHEKPRLSESSKTYSGLFSLNFHATQTNLAKSSGGPYVATELRGDDPAVEHLATGTEA